MLKAFNAKLSINRIDTPSLSPSLKFLSENESRNIKSLIKTDFSGSSLQKLVDQNLIRNQVSAIESLVQQKGQNEDWFVKTRRLSSAKAWCKVLHELLWKSSLSWGSELLYLCAGAGCFPYPFFSERLPPSLTTGFWVSEILRWALKPDDLGSNLSCTTDSPHDLRQVLNLPVPQAFHL